jgi:uncharacterized protein YabE (DUF348 family)
MGGACRQGRPAGISGGALANAGVSLVGMDYSVPGIDSPLPADGSVRVVRVTEIAEIDQKVLPFETTWAPASEIEIDHQQLVDAGEPGVVARRTRVRYEDGEEIRRADEAEWVASESRESDGVRNDRHPIRDLNGTLNTGGPS